MFSRARFGCLAGLSIAAIASGGVDDAGGGAKAFRFPHASLTAYPGAVVSLKDGKTGMTFYVESDGRKLIALDGDGEPAWGLDVVAEARVAPAVGKPVVRHLRLDGNRLWATCGKHDFVAIDVTTGKVEHVEAD